jgi:DNA mismatch endonuclease, patch repair protein
MSDVFTKEKRSQVMSRIRGKGNESTELKMVRLLREKKITGWRRHYAQVMGRPDFIWPKKKIAVFIDGCFWHGCPKCFQMPKNNRKFWAEKIAGNKKRDMKVNKELRKKGWRVIRIWEHSLEKESSARRVIIQMEKWLDSLC